MRKYRPNVESRHLALRYCPEVIKKSASMKATKSNCLYIWLFKLNSTPRVAVSINSYLNHPDVYCPYLSTRTSVSPFYALMLSVSIRVEAVVLLILVIHLEIFRFLVMSTWVLVRNDSKLSSPSPSSIWDHVEQTGHIVSLSQCSTIFYSQGSLFRTFWHSFVLSIGFFSPFLYAIHNFKFVRICTSRLNM